MVQAACLASSTVAPSVRKASPHMLGMGELEISTTFLLRDNPLLDQWFTGLGVEPLNHMELFLYLKI